MNYLEKYVQTEKQLEEFLESIKHDLWKHINRVRN